jgi:ABC-type glutathione transport system ATPase component
MAKIQLEQQTNERKHREREANEVKRREEESRREVDEKLRRADEEKAAYQRQLKQQEDEAKRRETEVIEARDRRNREVEEQQRQADEQLAAVMQKKLQVEQKLSEGIQPLLWPTQEQVDAAKDRVQYNPERLHFAVCGPSGSGKSSLINAFRGLKNGEEGTAEVSNDETTLEVTRYQDPRKEMPYPRFVWCDIPGAGTIEISAWQYFNQQGLFIFDFIILVYGGVCKQPNLLCCHVTNF